jgi:uncharacterized short protein YbdD (DUF466 family)
MSDRRATGTGREGAGLRDAVRALMTAVRRIAGMPDYRAHLEHLRRCHPERAIPSEREFYEEFVRARYADGPTRCC